MLCGVLVRSVDLYFVLFKCSIKQSELRTVPLAIKSTRQVRRSNSCLELKYTGDGLAERAQSG